jgi:AraC-like DNA-binding protein
MNKYKFLAYCCDGVDGNDVTIRINEQIIEILSDCELTAEAKMIREYRDLFGFSPENWTLKP